MENYWFNSQILEELKNLSSDFPPKESYKIIFIGEKGITKHDWIQFYVSHYPLEKIILNELDFSIQDFSTDSFLFESFKFYLNNLPEFEQYLSGFSRSHQKYIRHKLENFPKVAENYIDWYLEIYLEFLAFHAKNVSFFIILENVDQLDQQDFEKLLEFLNNFQELPVQMVFSRDRDRSLKQSIPAAQEVLLSKLSIHSVEKAIQKFCNTSVVNARLVTNHCYLKTAGNPLKITLLLASIYRSILQKNQQEFINLKNLQKLKIPESWEEIFHRFYQTEEKTAAKILASLTLLDEPIPEQDFINIVRHFNFKNNFYKRWVELGIMGYIHHEGESCIRVHQHHFTKWVKREIPVEELSDILIPIAQMQVNGELQRVYLLSELLHRCHETELATILAEKEGRYFLSKGQYLKAADRLYFVIRISDSGTTVLPHIAQLLELLGDTYLYIRSYENAFEILKKYRSTFYVHERENELFAKSKWLEINLKMAKALVEMDSYQEARYLIRETRVKKFCHPRIIGQCYELLGDIEVNLAHSLPAIQHYRKALISYRETGNSADLFQLYFKLKNLLRENFQQQLELIQQILVVSTRETVFRELRAVLLRDKIHLLLQNKAFDKALRDCIELQQLLAHLYQPKLKVQLAFYLGEIYAQRGKWHSALEQLTRASKENYVLQRPDLFIQTLIQLALIYKEQALYGNALRILNSALEQAVKKEFLEQMNEIKLHLGHLYLLVHNFLKAFESLGEVQEWADRQQKNHLRFLVRLYLSYYEIRQKRMDKARRLLSESKRILNLNFNLIDYLNYLFYLTIWLINRDRQTQALRVVQQLLSKSKKIPRYQTSGYYLRGMAEFRLQNITAAKDSLKKGLALSSSWNFPQIKYLILCEQARQSGSTENQKQSQLRYQRACRYIKSMAENFGDEILGTQFLESKTHVDILVQCKK
ncbi:MAG: hypothetical protein A2Y94_10760 [Caldithrix sp. RBG_13_44_9]|nr:MAG: hypothetical protein A2Y94_10760 [Caldithrix sp. RBG_13_44_9]